MAEIAKMRANGGTVRDIAAVAGVSPSSISRNLQSSAAKEIIERETQRLLEAVPDITGGSIKQIKVAAQIHQALTGGTDDNGDPVTIPGDLTKGEALDYLKIVSKRETDILKAVGVLASPVQSVVIQQIYNDHRKATLTPDVLKALSGISQPDIEDAEIIGGENNA